MHRYHKTKQPLYWKAKVAHRSLAIAACLLLVPPTFAQQKPAPLAVSFEHATIRDVLDQLAAITGLHFIYSTSRVDSGKRITAVFRDTPIDEILRQVAADMGLVFRRQGNYVIVKPANVIQAGDAKPDRKINDMARVQINTPNALETPLALAEAADAPAAINAPLPFRSTYLQHHAPVLQPYFDTAALKHLAPGVLRAIDTRAQNRRWFFSAGVVLKDYAAGIELQAGLRNLYFIISPRWLSTAEIHTAYGLGTSLLLRHNVSLQPTYMYSGLSTERVAEQRSGVFYSQRFYSMDLRHHQLTLRLQYALTPNIVVRAGPTLNYLASKHVLRAHLIRLPRGTPLNAALAPLTARRPVESVLIGTEALQGESTAQKTWLGWDAGLALRLNF